MRFGGKFKLKTEKKAAKNSHKIVGNCVKIVRINVICPSFSLITKSDHRPDQNKLVFEHGKRGQSVL